MNRSNLPWSSREDKEKKIFEGKNSSSMRRNSGKKDSEWKKREPGRKRSKDKPKRNEESWKPRSEEPNKRLIKILRDREYQHQRNLQRRRSQIRMGKDNQEPLTRSREARTRTGSHKAMTTWHPTSIRP